jgi:hypothetical protein
MLMAVRSNFYFIVNIYCYDLEIAFWMQIKSWREGAAIKLRPGRQFVRLKKRDSSISTAKSKFHGCQQ